MCLQKPPSSLVHLFCLFDRYCAEIFAFLGLFVVVENVKRFNSKFKMCTCDENLLLVHKTGMWKFVSIKAFKNVHVHKLWGLFVGDERKHTHKH